MWLLAIQSGIELSGCAIRMSCADALDVLITNKSMITSKLLYLLQPNSTLSNKIDTSIVGHVPCLPIHALQSSDFLLLKSSFVPCVSIHHNRADMIFQWKNCMWIAVALETNRICAARIQHADTPTHRIKKNIYAHTATSVLFKQDMYTVTEEFVFFVLDVAR